MTEREGNNFVDCFEILGVSETDDAETISIAYRRMAKVTHPDAGGNSNHEEFARLQNAYETLTNEKKRQEHIREREIEYGRRSLIGIKPIVRDVFDDIVEYAKDIGGYRRKDEYELRIRESFTDRDKRIELVLPLSSTCSKCKGVGSTLFFECSECDGKGTIEREKTVEIEVKADTPEGTVVRLDVDSHVVNLRVVYE